MNIIKRQKLDLDFLILQFTDPPSKVCLCSTLKRANPAFKIPQQVALKVSSIVRLDLPVREATSYTEELEEHRLGPIYIVTP